MAAPLRKVTETVENTDKQKATAFVNWQIPGSKLKSSKGFTIFQNPQYPNKAEDKLVELAKKHGGTVTVNMQCRISLNTNEEISLDDIPIVTPTVVPITE